VGITAARICEWESGRTAPSLRSLFAFLLGLGYDLKVLQDEVEQLAEAGVAAPPPPVKENRSQRGARRLADIQASKRYLEELSRRQEAEE
jgi:transcriptional regulator with XRE-family HTH domain